MEQNAKIYSIYDDVFLVEKLQKELKKVEKQLRVEGYVFPFIKGRQ